MSQDRALNHIFTDNSDEAEELLELDEAEDLLDAEDQDTEDSSNEELLDSHLFLCEKRKYETAGIPAFFMDKNLQILWLNSSSKSFFNISEISGALNLQTIFHPYLNEVRLNQIKNSIYKTDKGFSWSGKIELSGDDIITSTGNMIILPFYSEPSGNNFPDGYFGIIDDLTEEKSFLLRNIFTSLLEASKLKDNDTGNHIERVNQYSHAIALELYMIRKYPEINMQFVENIKFLAAMHDVGKIGTPDNILNKPAKLTDDEWEIMKEHTINGAFILSSYPDKMAMEIARSHHEKWNGTGYPYGLKEKDIPLSSRIVAIADVYDALRMKRSYKESFSHEYAADILLKGSGSHFDPELIDIFSLLEASFNSIYEKYSD